MPPGSSIQKKSGLPTGNPASLLQECLAYGVLVAGARGRIVACTPEAAALLRLPAARLQKAPLKSLPAPFPKLIRDAAKNGRLVTNREIRLKTSRRDAITLRASILPVQGRGQSQVVVVLNNQASVPVFEQNMRRLDRLASLGTLSASMAHEIKNGMVAIKTFIDLLMQRGQDTELTEVVSRELQRINAIVTQMMRFAAPKGTTFATVRVHELLDHSLRLLHHQIAGKLISLQRHYQAETDAVRGDDVQLQQAFMNLLLNALEAMDTKGALTVATETMEGKRGARWMRIHIQDTGAGIARENLERLFEPFFTTKRNGTGLGLAISQRIAHEHRGVIQVQSEINQGSTFSFLIPVLPSRPPLSKPATETVDAR
ncbi:MAG TPA: ATP-binding protein [Verrucomicrobiae bacterium]|nr:ATP-binding protein [Verrucomicrobiae bacterium]